MAVPDGCMDILFCCDEKNPSADICGTVLHPLSAHMKKEKYYFGIRFLPGNILPFPNIWMKDFIANQVPFLDVVDQKELFEKITGSRDFNYQIQTFMEFYLTYYEENQNRDKYRNLKNYMIRRINETAGQMKVNELADETNYSVRYINRIFTEELGISPKVFCKIIRFQDLLSHLNQYEKIGPDNNLAQIAITLGYCDQSHMMKDFYELSNTTPGKYLHSLMESEYKNRIIVI